MATIVFYEKPGCGTNARQKRALSRAGHNLIVRDLLAEPFSAPRLRAFFGDLPVPAWFNPSAPAIKAGTIDPEAVDGDTALELMLADPLLIRRPLLETGGGCCAGFDPAQLAARLGLSLNEAGQVPDSCIRPGEDPG